MIDHPRLLCAGADLLPALFPDVLLADSYIEVAYSDYCVEFRPEFSSWTTKWARRGLLFCESALGVAHDFDWGVQSRITICPWESILELRSAKSDECIAIATQAVLQRHACSVRKLVPDLPFVCGAPGELILVCAGNPKSERSAKGKLQPRETVAALRSDVTLRFPKPLTSRFEAFVETFAPSGRQRPDIDRAIPPILDAFGGIVYEDDKQVSEVHHRVFQESDLLVQLEIQSHPTIGLQEIASIPMGSLAPLMWGDSDYHVIRLNALE